MLGWPSHFWVGSVAVVAALVAGYSLGASVERKARIAEVATLRWEHSELVAEAALQHAIEVDAMRRLEQSLRGDIENMQAQRAQEIASAKIEHDRLVADVRAGHRRLSIAVKSCAATGTQAGSPSQGTGAVVAAAFADIDDAAAERLIAIAREGDDAIRDLNACIGAYEAVRRRINGADAR